MRAKIEMTRSVLSIQVRVLNPRSSLPLTYTSGDLEVNEDEFPDHDERVHGPMDTEENRRDNPLGFIWDCCEANGVNEPGCEIGQHISSAKRTRT